MTTLKGVVHGALLAIGFCTHAVFFPNSDGTKQELMVEIESLKESLANVTSNVMLLRADVTSLEESLKVRTAMCQKLEKNLVDIKLEMWQFLEEDRKKVSRVSYEEMDQKKRSDLVLKMKAEYGIFKY